MKRIGSVQVSVVAFVVLLAYQCKGECNTTTSYSAHYNHNATIPTKPSMITETTKQHKRRPLRVQQTRQVRESYRRPELPVFGTDEYESRMNVHNSRNRTRDDNTHRHYRPVMKHIKKSSSTSSIKSAISPISTKSSSKKTSKRDGFVWTIRPTSLPTTLLPTVLPTMSIVGPTVQPSTMMPTTAPSVMPSFSVAPSQNPTRNPTPMPTPPTAITSPPTADGAFAIEAATYSLFFFFDDTTGDIRTTDEDFIQLQDVTRLFLDDYFDGRYGGTFIISFDEALTQVVGFSSISLPIQTFFLSTILFSETSIFYPPRSEVELEIEKAFTTFGSNFEYLMAIRGLPRTNPFQAISSVNWGGYGTG